MRRPFLAIATLVLLFVFGLGAFVGWSFGQGQLLENQRPIGDIRKDVKAFVKNSKTKDPAEKSAAIFDLCILHREIVSDARFFTDDNMKSFRAVVGNRLKDCKREVELAELRRQRELKRQNKNKPKVEEDNFFQEKEEEWNAELDMAQTMSEYIHVVGQVTGGPSHLFSYANGNFGPGNAQDLIDLIESTIDPDSWQTNGGNGRMFFYRPVCALVVSASSDVQDRISDLLRTIRRTSR